MAGRKTVDADASSKTTLLSQQTNGNAVLQKLFSSFFASFWRARSFWRSNQ